MVGWPQPMDAFNVTKWRRAVRVLRGAKCCLAEADGEMTDTPEIDLSTWQPSAPRFCLRDYQQSAFTAINEGWSQYSRQLLDMATRTGKSSLLNPIAPKAVREGARALLLQNRDQLVRMSAKRVFDETGIEAEIEMAG